MATLNRRNALKLFASLGAAGAAAPLLSACSSSGDDPASDRPVRVALIVPQSGALQPMGDEMTAGFNLFLSRNGSLLGNRRTQVSVHDEGGSASSGKAAVSDALETAQADVLVGIASSTVMSAIRETVEKAQVPLVGTAGSPNTLRSPKYIWRASYVSGEAGGVLGVYFNQHKVKSIFVYDDGSTDGVAEAAVCRQIYTGRVDTWSGSASKAINRIQSSDADVVFAAASGAKAVDFLKAYADANIDKPLYGPGFLTEGYVLKQEGAAARQVYTALNYSYDLDNDANRTFASAYYNADNEQAPSTYAMATYDALNILDRAIRDIDDEITPLAINAALGRVGQFDSPRGAWQFNQNRTPQQTWYLRQVRPDGKVWLNKVLERAMAPVLTF